MTTKLKKPKRPDRWRNYVDLTPAEKTAARRMYVKGCSVMEIAHRWRVYPGTVTTAAEIGRWRRPGGVPSVGDKIGVALGKHPTWTDTQISELLGCDPSYVHTIRHRLRARKAQNEAKRPQ